jgi:hypothetical protein
MAELLVGSALSYHLESKGRQQPFHLLWLQNRRLGHWLPNDDLLGPYEVGLKRWFTVFEQHGHDFSQVRAELV